MQPERGPEQSPAAALARRPGSWAVLGAYVALVAASHVLAALPIAIAWHRRIPHWGRRSVAPLSG